jgi:Uma2 family endonuclease
MSTATLQQNPPLTAPGRVSYEDFLRSDCEEHSEWVDGKVVLMSPVSKEHADVAVWLSALLRFHAEHHQSGRVFTEPFQMKTGPDLPGRAPDVMFVANASLGRLQRLCLEGPADLVIEVISPGSRGTDRGEKFYEYEQGGVPEYWLIDPDRRQVEFYQRGANQLFQLTPADANGIYHSRAMPGLWLKTEWLWQMPLPSLAAVLREWRIL